MRRRLLAYEHLVGAVHSLRRTRTRTLLTTLGVAIGVASITTILSLSGGVTQSVESEISSLGGRIMVVRPGYPHEHASGNFGDPLGNSSYSTSTLTDADYYDILDVKGVDQVAPLMIMSGRLATSDNHSAIGTIVATTPSFAKIAGLKVETGGQFMDKVTNDNTAVVGQQLAIDVFGTTSPLGQQLTVRGRTFTIIGVLERINKPINYNNFDMDDALYINLSSGESFHQNMSQIQQIDVMVDKKSELDHVRTAVTDRLKENHFGEHDFTIVTGKEIARPTNRLFVTMTAVMTAIAAISLVVGGIGIMNIMLVGVAERTREIGLRKAVGASNGQIVGQFLVESLLISLVGGIIGYVGGYIIAFGISTVLTFNPSLTWQIAVVAGVVSLVVGALFGAYPAFRAARKDPIESLRVYH